MNKHITIVALLHFVMGAMGLVALGLIFVLALLGFSLAEFESRENLLFIGALGSIIFGIMLISTIPNLIIGYGLLNRRSWARTATIILSVLNLFAFPFGTLLGGYGLWVMLQSDVTRELGRHQGPIPTTTFSSETTA